MKKLLIFFLFFSVAYSVNLEKLLEQAEKNNPRVKYYLHRIKSKDFYLEQILSKYKPKVSSSLYYGYQEFKPYYGEKKKATLKYFYTVLEQPIFLPEVIQEFKQGKIEKDIERLYFKKYLQDFRYDILRNLITLAYLKEKKELYEKVIKDREKINSILETLLKRKVSTELELLLEKEKLQMDLSEYRKTRREIENLKEVLGIYLPTEKIEKIPSMKPPESPTFFEELYDSLKKEKVWSLDVEIARKQLEHAKREVKKRKLERLPKLSAQLSYLYSSTTAAATVSRDKRIALILNVPVYNGGYFKARVGEALELERASLYALKSVEKETKVQYEENLKNLESVLKDLNTTLRILTMERELLKMNRILFSKGVKTEKDVLNQEISFIYRRLKYLESVYQFLMHYISALHTVSRINPEEVSKLNQFFDR